MRRGQIGPCHRRPPSFSLRGHIVGTTMYMYYVIVCNHVAA